MCKVIYSGVTLSVSDTMTLNIKICENAVSIKVDSETWQGYSLSDLVQDLCVLFNLRAVTLNIKICFGTYILKL